MPYIKALLRDMPDRFITDVLGNTLRVNPDRYYGDGSYDCPHCHTPVRADENFDLTRHNPWCIANPLMPVDRAQALVDKAKQDAEEAARRQRNHEWAMQRIKEDQQRRADEYAQAKSESEREGWCLRCWQKSYQRKKVRHRGGCPLERR